MHAIQIYAGPHDLTKLPLCVYGPVKLVGIAGKSRIIAYRGWVVDDSTGHAGSAPAGLSSPLRFYPTAAGALLIPRVRWTRRGMLTGPIDYFFGSLSARRDFKCSRCAARR